MLVYTKNGKGYVHENRASGTSAIQQLGKQYGFSVDVSDDPACFTDANLKQYALLIFNNTNNEVFDNDAQKVAFMRYVQQAVVCGYTFRYRYRAAMVMV